MLMKEKGFHDEIVRDRVTMHGLVASFLHINWIDFSWHLFIFSAWKPDGAAMSMIFF